MTRRTVVLPILAALAQTGCQPAWVANGTPDQPLAVASATCTQDASHGIFGVGISGFMNYRAWIDRCVASHGYRQVSPYTAPETKPS